MSLVAIIDRLIYFYGLLILIYVILSWFRPKGFLYEIFHVIGTVVEPYLALFRRFMPPTGAVDFSPLVAILVLQVIRWLLLTVLSRLGV